MMDCDQLAHLLSERGVGDLTPAERAAASSHLRECANCRESLGHDADSLALHVAAEQAYTHEEVHDGILAQLFDETANSRAKTVLGPPRPQRLGGFEILGTLGHGGMGIVYRARQTSVDRIVALKVLASSLVQDEEFVKRFQREACAGASVSHPNIVDVHDIGQQGTWHYISMEFVDGESLKDIIKREGRLTAARACALVTQTAEALREAHEAGVLHRDIKPSNILVTRKGRVKVVDFGLAKRPGVDMSVTLAGQALGTPLYFPPEAARGHQADVRSDLYSLGATFYHALAGRPPFEGDSATELALKHVEQEPPPLREIAPDVPPVISKIVHRLLAKNPAERYQSAEELLAALADARGEMESGGAASRNGTRHQGLRRPILRFLLPVSIAAVAALAVVSAYVRMRPAEPPVKKPPPPAQAEAKALFNGTSLEGWRVPEEDKFSQRGNVSVREGRICLEAGAGWTGIAFHGPFPTDNYEVVVEARRVSGDADFCDIYFPVGNSRCMLALGAKKGRVGLTLDDALDPRDNISARHYTFGEGEWHEVRLRVEGQWITVWLNESRMVKLDREAHGVEPWPGFDALHPFGICAWQTRAEIRKVGLTRLGNESGD